jgi:hypothetical protein
MFTYVQRIPYPGAYTIPSTILFAGLLGGEDKYLCQGSRIIPHCPSTYASAASAWGSQKVISMARYSSMAADSAA